MNKLIKAALAVLVIAGAATGVLAHADGADAATIKIPGTTITAPSAQRWSDTGVAYTINGGYKVDTRFYGMRHCYFNTKHSSHDGSMCFTVTASHVVLVLTASKVTVTSVKN